MSWPSGRRLQGGGWEAVPFFSSSRFALCAGGGNGNARSSRDADVALRGSSVWPGGATGMSSSLKDRCGLFRWNPCGLDAKEVAPGSAALPRRPGRRRAAASFVPDGARPEVAFSPEAPTRVSRPSPSTSASRSGSSPRPEAQLASLPNRTAVELAITPGGSTARRSRWNEGVACEAALPGRTHQVGGPNKGGRFSLPRIVRLMALP